MTHPIAFPGPVDDTTERLIAEHVALATTSYAGGMPGHGEYLLTRLRLKLERLEATLAEARDVLARP